MADPLLPPDRVMQTLVAIPVPPIADDDATTELARPVQPSRMLRLAASASRQAALSSRQELYPRAMPALQALRQSLGALVTLSDISVAELCARVRGRYLDAQPLPARPAADPPERRRRADQSSVGRLGHTPSAWLLLPTRKQGLPMLDGTPVPLVSPAAAVWLPRAWLENRHRAQPGISTTLQFD